MSIHKVGKKFITTCTFLAIYIVVSSVETACDAKSSVNAGESGVTASQAGASERSPDANPDTWFEGTWTGQARTKDGTIVSVILSITHLKTGKVSAILIYGGSRSCTIQGTYEGIDTNKRIFSLTSRNGGTFCDRPGVLTVWKTDTKTISYTMTSRDRRFSEEGTLTRSADNPVTGTPTSAGDRSADAQNS